jgi:hypothetical protein
MSVVKVIEIMCSSKKSWEDATATGVAGSKCDCGQGQSKRISYYLKIELRTRIIKD